jgi:hypothetical protein
MISIHKYRKEYNKSQDVYIVKAGETIPCPICGETLRPKGWPKRVVIEEDGTKSIIKVQRRKCSGCKKYHRELPDFIIPYKRHCLKTVEQIINCEEKTTCIETETIRKIKLWWSLILDHIIRILESIKEKYGIDLTALAPGKYLAKIVRSVVNTNLWPGTRSVFLSVP